MLPNPNNRMPTVGINCLKVTRGQILSHVCPFYEQAVSDLDRPMHRSLWVQVTHSSFIEGSHMTKNTAPETLILPSMYCTPVGRLKHFFFNASLIRENVLTANLPQMAAKQPFFFSTGNSRYQSPNGATTLTMTTLVITTFGIMTFGIMTFSIMTLGIMTLMTLSIMTLGIMTLGIMTLGIMTLGITTQSIRCHYPECRIF